MQPQLEPTRASDDGVPNRLLHLESETRESLVRWSRLVVSVHRKLLAHHASEHLIGLRYVRILERIANIQNVQYDLARFLHHIDAMIEHAVGLERCRQDSSAKLDVQTLQIFGSRRLSAGARSPEKRSE